MKIGFPSLVQMHRFEGVYRSINVIAVNKGASIVRFFSLYEIPMDAVGIVWREIDGHPLHRAEFEEE